MAKQVGQIQIRLGIEGLQGIDKLKGAFRELEKSLGPSESSIKQIRDSIIKFGRDSKNTDQVIRGQIEALKGLQAQAERGSSTWNQLSNDIEKFRQASRRTDKEIQVLRNSILAASTGTNQSRRSIQEYITDLSRLRDQANITGDVFNELSKDIDVLNARLQAAEDQTIKTGRAFGRVLGQALAATSAGARQQLADLKDLIAEQRQQIDTIDSLTSRERRLTHNIEARAAAQEKLNNALGRQRQLTYQESIRTGREGVIAGAAAFGDENFIRNLQSDRLDRLYGALPNTTAALNQELAELSERLVNTTRGSSTYVDVSVRMAQVQRELRQELVGTAGSFSDLARAQAAANRQATKRESIAAYYAPTELRPPGEFGYRDPSTGAMIAGGAGPFPYAPGQAYTTPSGPQPFPEAAKTAQRAIESSLEDINRIYADARVRRAEIQAKYDQIHIDKLLQGLDLEGQVRDKAFRDELAAFDRQLQARDRKRRSRLTTGQAVQSAGAIISGGIFGGPEGFLGGLGGFAAGLAIPGLGPVGGAFAGSAAGAQVGALRQSMGAAAEYAAEIRRLQLALQGVVYSFDDYKASLKAIQSTSEQFNVPVQQSTQQFTKLAAAVIGSGGSVKDADTAFKGITASVLATGGSIEDVNGALLAAAQVFSKGKVSAEELRGQIGERLAGAFALFAESSNKSTQQLDKDLKDGEVTIQQFVDFTKYALEKYGRTADIIAKSPEQAGARLDKALKNLQQSIGDSLGPAGAAFQDFAARSVRGLDRVIEKLIRLKAIQPGAGYYQEQVLSGALSIPQLEQEVLAAGSRETTLRQQISSVGLGFIADLLPDIQAATKEARILEEALIKIRRIEKETNKEKKERKDAEDKAQKDALGQRYIQALEQREEALADARLAREEQIARIRKDAVEQSFRLERDLADERVRLQRESQRVSREMGYGSEELDRLRRLAAGEDPKVIEAERRAAEISQSATEAKVKLQEDFLDKELDQQRTIADFQKNVAKQIAEANQQYAKQVGNIQKDFAKASAKIIEEGSGTAAKRLTLGAQIISQVLQRTALNQQRAQRGESPIPEPIGFKGGKPVYSGSQADSVPTAIQRIDIRLEKLLQKLQKPPQNQSALPGTRISSTGIGEQFLGMLGAQSKYEDVAGLLPLPIEKMRAQAARPLRLFWEQVQDMTKGLYSVSRREAQRYLQQQRGFDLPARRQRTLESLQRVESFRTTDRWDPAELQWQERSNRWNPDPRSRPSGASLETFKGVAQTISNDLFMSLNGMNAALYGLLDDISDYLNENQVEILRKGIREQLRQGVSPSAIKQTVTGGNPNTGRANIRAIIQQLVNEEAFLAAPGTGLPPVPRIGPLNEPPRIIPGIENQFEGATLPGQGFNISRLPINMGNVATASIANLMPAAKQTTQQRQQNVQQQEEQIDQDTLIRQFQVLSDITKTSRDTKQNLIDQSREIELQLGFLQEGIEPTTARQLANIRQAYETQKQDLEREAKSLIQKGANVEQVEKQKDLELQNLETLRQQNEALVKQNDERTRAIERSLRLVDAYVNPIQQGLTQTFDTLINGTDDWRNSLKDIAENVLKDIARQLVQILIIETIIAAVRQGLQSMGTPKPKAPAPDIILAANGHVFNKGLKRYAMGGIVNKPTMFKYADGGTGSFGLMGEAGPEAIIPLRRGPDGRLGVSAYFADSRAALGNRSAGAGASAFDENRMSMEGAATIERERRMERLITSGAGSTEIRYSRVGSGDLPFVTEEDMLQATRVAAQEGARLGQARTLAALKNNPGARRSIGI